MIRWTPPQNPLVLIKNEPGALHCAQDCMIMAIYSIKGQKFTMEEAEKLTGYVKGRDTWPYEMYLSFSKMGILTKSIEIVDPKNFVKDPEKEIKRVWPGKIGDYIINETDLELEKNRIKQCLESSDIVFEVRQPTAVDIMEALKTGWLPMVSLDYGKLHNTNEGYEGHLVIISGMDDKTVELYDPGPPGDEALLVSIEKLKTAIQSPTNESGAVILIKAK